MKKKETDFMRFYLAQQHKCFVLWRNSDFEVEQVLVFIFIFGSGFYLFVT